MKPRYCVAVNSQTIAIYDLKYKKMYSPVRIQPFVAPCSSELCQDQKSSGTLKPAAAPGDVWDYANQVFQQLVVDMSMPIESIASIVFVLDDVDDHHIRNHLARIAKSWNVPETRFHLMSWQTALVMEALALAQQMPTQGYRTAVMVMFRQFYQIIGVTRIFNQWHVRMHGIFTNDFSPHGFKRIRTTLKQFSPHSVLIYFYTRHLNQKLVKMHFEKGFSPKPVKFYYRTLPRSMNAIDGALLKARTFVGDPVCFKYNVTDVCYQRMRLNIDNKSHVTLRTFLRPYPFRLSMEADCKDGHYLWVEQNGTGTDHNWKMHQIYPYKFELEKVTVELKFDRNGLSTIAIDNPPPEAEGDTRDYTFAHFKLPRYVRQKVEQLAPLRYVPAKEPSPPPSALRNTRSGGRQRRNYFSSRGRKRKAPTTTTLVVKKTKVKKTGAELLETKKLRVIAKRMRKWQNSRFLLES